MMYQWLLTLKKPSNQLWVTPAIWALVTVSFVFSLRLGARTLKAGILPDITQDTLDGLLDVIASSMLAVSTFSLSIMVSAFVSAASNATPRATDLVMGDQNTRTAITSFICAFIYAIIAKTALGMEFYEQNGRFILFISTVAVLAYLIVTLIRWVYTLSQLGRLGNTLSKIEKVTAKALHQYRLAPSMQATRVSQLSPYAKSLRAGCSGYLTHIDMQTLQSQAQQHDCAIHINVRPGELITPDTVLCLIDGEMEDIAVLQQSFVFARERTFEQDPHWGFIVLSEAAQRALSPAVNDPGTAINVMTIMMSLLLNDQIAPQSDDVGYDRLSIKALDFCELIRDGFSPISRDGAGILEVNLVMQKVLAGIWRNVSEPAIAEAAFEMAQLALARAKNEMTFEPELNLLIQKHQVLFEQA